MILFTNARIIDGTGAAPRDGQALLVDGNRIAAIGVEAAIRQSHNLPPDTKQIDLKGKTLLPGFIDCHVHLLWNPDPKAPPQFRSKIPVRDDAYWKSRNLLYAVQWWIFAGFAIYIWQRWCRDQVEAAAETAHEPTQTAAG